MFPEALSTERVAFERFCHGNVTPANLYEGVLRHHAGRYDEPADHHRFSISRQEFDDADGARTTVSLR